jgi:hypothetical protein
LSEEMDSSQTEQVVQSCRRIILFMVNAAQPGELGLFVLELTHARRAKLGYALGQDHAILAQEPAYFIH